jgi:large subunit ribosomal protein L14
VRVLIVRTRKEVGRKDGSYVRFDDNAGVVIDKQGLPRGTRILGPIAREIKEAGYNKIASLAREVV